MDQHWDINGLTNVGHFKLKVLNTITILYYVSYILAGSLILMHWKKSSTWIQYNNIIQHPLKHHNHPGFPWIFPAPGETRAVATAAARNNACRALAAPCRPKLPWHHATRYVGSIQWIKNMIKAQSKQQIQGIHCRYTKEYILEAGGGWRKLAG